MARRSTGIWIWGALLLLGMVLLALAAGGFLAQRMWRDWRQANGVEQVQLQGFDLAWSGLTVERLDVLRKRSDRIVSVQARGLALDWSWGWPRPQVGTLTLEALELDWQAGPDSQPAIDQLPQLALPENMPFWFPRQLVINRMSAGLPCGPERCVLESRLSLTTGQDAWELQLDEAHLKATRPELTLAGWKIRGIRADLNHQQLTATYNLKNTTLESLAIEGPVEITAQGIGHSLLHPQPWRFRGDLKANRERLDLSGALRASAGAATDLKLSYPYQGELEAEARLVAEGENGVKALAETLTFWPSELTIDRGRLSGRASLRLPGKGKSEARGEITFDGLSGVYDRMALEGLNGTVEFSLDDASVNLQAPMLKIDQINPGIPIGPITVSARYQTPADQLLKGNLTLEQASAGLLGGKVRVEPATWALDNTPVLVPLELTRLEVSQLMRVYPAEGLAGTGLLRGHVPLLIGPEGIRVVQGQVEAIDPGGVLQLPAERLRDFAQDNKAMGMVTQAMRNFHYSELESRIDYGQDGTLNLGLHLEGHNPNVQDGHPIVLNINLEENIPALLTSLQLSGRVNETVTKKVRELIRKRQAE